jgi:hypothetical protein
MEDIEIGKYRHFKGGEYKIICVAMDADDLGRNVVYQGLYHKDDVGEHPIFVRSLKEFSEIITRADYSGPRFALVSKDGPCVCKDCGASL